MFDNLLHNHIIDQAKTFQYSGNRMTTSEEFDMENRINSFVTINRSIRKTVRENNIMCL
jgi:hypothetical protein